MNAAPTLPTLPTVKLTRDSAYRGGARIAREYGGQGTVTVFIAEIAPGRRLKVDAMGAQPHLRKAAALRFARTVQLEAAAVGQDAETVAAINSEIRALQKANGAALSHARLARF